MRDVSIGQYYPVKSVIHRMDARAKIIVVVAYIVMLFFVPTLDTFTKRGGNLNSYLVTIGCAYILIAVFFFMILLLSRVPIVNVFKSLRAIIFLVLFTAIITLLFYGGEAAHVYWEWGVFKVSLEGIVSAGAMALRLFFLVLGPSVLTITTTPVQLTDGIESLLYPLTYIKVPVHDLAIIMSIALRLIPTLVDETDKIINAQKARCADFESGNIFKRAKAMVPILVPLLVSSFRRADELAYAMDSRCYRGSKCRTRMKEAKLSLRDFVGLLIMAIVFFLVLVIVKDYFGTASFICSLIGVV